MIKKSTGLPPELTYKTTLMIADAIQHNSTIKEACKYAGISRNTYYRYLSNEVFAEKMEEAYCNQDKVVFSFMAPFQIN